MVEAMDLRTANLLRERQVIRLVFPTNDRLLVQELNKIPYLEQTNGAWETPYSQDTIALLKRLNFVFSNSFNNPTKAPSSEPRTRHNNYSEPFNEKLKLYNFQKEGVQFIEKCRGRALIADEMGLGKTVQALAWLKNHQDFRPVLIICPASLKMNWQREIYRWMGVQAEILSGTTPRRFHNEIVIINYDILPYWVEYIRAENFTAVVVDEAHYIKNNSAKRTKAFKRIVKTIPKLVALSGTPIENKPVEIYNIVQAINPLLFPNFILFAHEYCGAKKTPFGWDFSGATNSKKLHHILKSTIMIRRKKIDVLSELPPKHVVKVSLKIDNKTEYKKAENEFIRFLQEKFNRPLDDELKNELKQFANRHKIGVSDELTDDEIQLLKENKFEKVAAAPILAQIEILKQLAIKGKLKQITDWIEDFLESGEKLVVFGIHRKTVDFLFEKFPTAVKIDGSTSQIQRQKAVDRFQTDPNVKLFIGNIRAAGVGITLTAASNAAIIEFPWSPGELVQASDRIHRITQTKQVTIYNLVGAGTIEERIIDLLKAKSNVISQVLDGRVYEDKSILMELINIYRTKK